MKPNCVLGEVEQEDLGLIYPGQLDRVFSGNCGAVARAERLARLASAPRATWT